MNDAKDLLANNAKGKKLAKKMALKEKAAAKPAPECATRLSIFGNKFPSSTEAEWTEYKGIGWVHSSEDYEFGVYYRMCSVTGEYFKTINGEFPVTTDSKVISYKEAEKNWQFCPVTGRYFKPEDGVEVCDNYGTPTMASKESIKSHYRKCDFSGKYFPRTACRTIKGSDKYKYVAVMHFNSTNGFKECPNCSASVERKTIQYRDDVGSDMCIHCYTTHINQYNILQHNANSYPSPIYGKQFRLGCRRIGDEIFALNKKVEVLSPRLWGVEIETEMSLAACRKHKWNRHDLAKNAKAALGKDFVITKEDGTLTMNGKYSDSSGIGPVYAGFEIVTCPADMNTHKERWKKFDQMVGYSALRAWDTETCGMHVHVGKKTITTLQLGRMLTFINHSNNKKFIQKIAGRSERKFTRYVDKNPTDALHPERVINDQEEGHRNRSRRVALNVSNEQTIEWRIFRGTVNVRHILRNLEFCEAMVEFCYPSARSIKEFYDERYFIDFVSKNRKRWSLLAGWMAHWKMIAAPTLGEKANRELITLKPEVDEHEDKTDGNYEPEEALVSPGGELDVDFSENEDNE